MPKIKGKDKMKHHFWRQTRKSKWDETEGALSKQVGYDIPKNGDKKAEPTAILPCEEARRITMVLTIPS